MRDFERLNILKTYKLIPIEETEGSIKLLAPKGYNKLLLEEIRFLSGKEVDVVIVLFAVVQLFGICNPIAKR